MSTTYTIATLAQRIAVLKVAVNELSQTVNRGTLATGPASELRHSDAGDSSPREIIDFAAMVGGVVDIGKALDALCAELRDVGRHLRRVANSLIVVDELGGRSPGRRYLSPPSWRRALPRTRITL